MAVFRFGMARLGGALALLVAPWLAQAISVTLYPVADTTLFQNSPDDNLGSVPTFICGTTAIGQSNRALVKFDPAGVLPPDAVVQSVVLTLNVTKTIATDAHRFRLHRMRREWGEGTGVFGTTGRPAEAGEATWNAWSFPDGLWAQPGGGATNDYEAAPSAETLVLAEGAYDFSSSNLIADVKSWQSGSNFGWILVCANEQAVPSARRFASREDATYTPQLRIEYQVPERPYAVLAPVADTSLFEYYPENNLGAADLAVGSIGLYTNRTRALLRFDPGSLPAGAAIVSASLHLSVTRAGGGPASKFRLYRLLRAWGEGDRGGLDGAAAVGGDTTWNYRFYPGEPWGEPGAQPGVDYATNWTAEMLGDSAEWTFTNLAPDLSLWQANPGTNFGWIIIGQSEDIPRTARRLASRENADLGPYLTVEYVQPPQIENARMANGMLSFDFDALAYRQYRLEYRGSFGSGQWQTRTNLPLPVEHGPVQITIPSSASPIFYRVALDP